MPETGSTGRTQPLYSISMATHNALHLVKRCFDALLANSPLSECEIIVSDNGSREPVVSYLRSLEKTFPIRIIEHPVGIGYLLAQNRAMKEVRGEWLVLLNPSTQVPKCWLDSMRAEFIRNRNLGICGVQGTCESLNDNCGGYGGGRKEYVETSCAMMPVKLMREIGLYDEGFRFGYCEDVDLSFRLQERGYGLGWSSINVNYIRGQQMAKSRTEEGIDVDGFLAYNQRRMMQKWPLYFKCRNFRQSVLIKRRGAIGDVLLTTPVIRELKRLHAHWEIDVETDVPEIFDRNPYIRTAFKKPTQSKSIASYDRIFDLNDSYEINPSVGIVESFAAACGIEVKDKRRWIYPDESDRKTASSLMAQERWAVIHPSRTDMPGRNWKAENFNSVCVELSKTGWKTAVVGNPASTPELSCDLDLRGKLSLHGLAAVIERASLFVGIESAPFHLAEAALIPAVCVVGSVDPHLRLMNLPFIKAVRDESVGCLGCHHVFPVPNHGSGCFRSSVYCMDNVTAKMVLDACEEVLNSMTYYSETDKIKDRVLPLLRGRGIDVGCRTHPITPECVGFDKNAGSGVTRVGDARELPYQDGEFDWLWSSHCLEDLEDTMGALKEWARVIRPGGLMGLYVPHPELYKGVNLDHKYPGFTPEQLAMYLCILNFEIVDSFLHDEPPDCYSSLVVGRKKGESNLIDLYRKAQVEPRPGFDPILRKLTRPEWVFQCQERIPAMKLFFSEPSNESSNLELCERLIQSYRLAYKDFSVDVGKIWGRIVSGPHSEMAAIIEDGNVEALSSLLGSLFASDLLHGMATGAEYPDAMSHDGSRVWLMKLGDELVSLGEMVGCIPVENPEQSEPAECIKNGFTELISKIESSLGISLGFPPVSKSYGFMMNERLLTMEQCEHLEVAHRVNELSLPLAAWRFVEIGGGFGGLCYWMTMLTNNLDSSYAIYDLPTSNVIQGYFLSKSLGKELVSLYGEDAMAIQIMPCRAIEGEKHCDIVINENSMPEMSESEAMRYLAWMKSNPGALFYSYNQECSVAGQHVVSELAKRTRGFKRISRSRAWVRRGYIEEVYRVE